ncbi:MerR family transcriptional regulator [Hespellia stercorisuis]|uniref:DNA-binding transcriptional regulator, MerR family n=1 Tax=Hespellia stercorisuis DSM 15480 TaxID=1121950 RepID=A0A1M6JLR5_9FIRM|nr:MerR family transcriptional regulator [Hespellia stercorisuis]SHJ47655.1 DNA-binding transcriptional regulator, MerR family [Hespellia stercorisuis DSM 15480]
MTIKEVEEQTGLPRSNIRFYEKENLIDPSRNKNNGYRDYSEKDVENITKIAYLRTLGISIEDIRNIVEDKMTLRDAVKKQAAVLNSQITDLNKAKTMCEKMLSENEICFDELAVQKYVAELGVYWDENRPVFKLDSVSFLYIWGSLITWVVIISLCLGTALLLYGKLPAEIPVQWSRGTVSSLADKKWIFVYPAVCIIIRFFLKPYIYVRLKMNNLYGSIIAEYLTNYMCFIALSIEIFSVLFIFGVVRNIVILLLADTVVLIGLLAIGIIKMDLRRNRIL